MQSPYLPGQWTAQLLLSTAFLPHHLHLTSHFLFCPKATCLISGPRPKTVRDLSVPVWPYETHVNWRNIIIQNQLHEPYKEMLKAGVNS